MKKFASLPFSNVPPRFDIPHNSAGLMVKEASASSSGSPFAIHLRIFLWNSPGLHPEVVNEKDLDFFKTRLAKAGALFHALS